MKRLAPIVAILLLAAAFRIVNTGHWPVWTDEGWSTWAASDPRLDAITEKVLTKDRHPPSFVMALSAWWKVAGDSRIASRFLSIAAGVLAVAALYRVTADSFGTRPGLYAGLLLSVLPIAVYYSEEIRDYGWLMLSVTLMALFFLRYLHRPGRTALLGYMISTAFMLYTGYFGGFVLAVQGIVGLFVWRAPWRDKAGLLAAWFGAVVLYIPWLVVLPRQLQYFSDGIAGLPTTPAGVFSAAGMLLSGQLAITGGLYVLGLWAVVEHPDKSTRWLTQMTLVLSGLGLFCLMAILNLKVGMLSARTLSFLAPFLMAICGYGLSQIGARARHVLALAILIILPLTATPLQPRLDYHRAAAAVAAGYSAGDLVVLENGWDDNAFRYEIMLALGDSAEPDILRTLPWVDNKQDPIPVVPQIESVIKSHRRVWVVNWLQPSQVIPFLDKGSDGFMQVSKQEVSVGDQYRGLYSDPTVRVVLYARPDAATFGAPRSFGDLLTLRDALYPSEIDHRKPLNVDLWWSALKPLPLDYSVGVFLLDTSGASRFNQDGPPGDKPTTSWPPDKMMIDRHTLTGLTPGEYQLGVQVYWYGDRKPLPSGNQPYIILGKVVVH